MIPEVTIQMLDTVGENAPLERELSAAFQRVLRSGRYILGEEVEQFEARCAEYLGVRHAIGVSSGTDALLLALMALGIGEGDEVLCPAFTFFATAGSIARSGATPVFVDVDERTFNIDVQDAAARITKRTKAIMPVHLFGQAADMAAVKSLADEHGLLVIEDAAQAFGARYCGRSVGSLGHFGAFSFYPTKNLGALGDAGLLTTEEDSLAEMARKLRVHGGRERYYHEHVGGNFRLDSMQAAILSVKMKRLDAGSRRRRANATAYLERLEPLAGEHSCLKLPLAVAAEEHVWNQFTLRLCGEGERDQLKQHLAANGVASEIYYPLALHRQQCFAVPDPPVLPVAERLAREVISLPNHSGLTAAEVDTVCRLLSGFLNG